MAAILSMIAPMNSSRALIISRMTMGLSEMPKKPWAIAFGRSSMVTSQPKIPAVAMTKMTTVVVFHGRSG